MRPGRRRRARRHHRSRHRMRRQGEDFRLPDEDGDGKRQTPLILLYLRALHPVRLSRRARSLARSLPLRALKSRFLQPRHLHLLPPSPGVVPPSTESSSSEVPSSDDSSAPEHGVGAISARVSSSEEVCTRSARAATRFARAASENGPTVMRLATARAANWGAAKLRSKRKSGPSGPIRTAGRTGAFFSD